MRLAFFCVVLATSIVACRQTTEPPVQLTASMQASAAVIPRGDTVTFTVNATGNNLFGVVIDFGDATGDQYATGGALTARVTFKHAYDTSGTFTARATVTDAIAGDREVSVSIVVN